jgi:hypothetical protein
MAGDARAVHLLGLTHNADFHPLLVVFSPWRGEKQPTKKIWNAQQSTRQIYRAATTIAAVRRAALRLRPAIRALADRHAESAHACCDYAGRGRHFPARNLSTIGECSYKRGFCNAR